MENLYALPSDASHELYEIGLMLASCPEFAEKFALLFQNGATVQDGEPDPAASIRIGIAA